MAGSGSVAGRAERAQPAEPAQRAAERTPGSPGTDGAGPDGVERFDVVVVGGGQSGLSVGYHLARRGLRFVILDGHGRVGDAWRTRWDSLRLFTPARFDGLAGLPFPAPAHAFPTKDEMADYLEAYAARFALPVRTGLAVERLSREGERYLVQAGARRFEAREVVVAMADWQRPLTPPFAAQVAPGVFQLHAAEYRNPAQLQTGGVLVVGAGNSGAEIALEVVREHPTWLSGRDTGHLPFRIDGAVARLILRPLFRGVFHRLLTVDTPLGRRIRPKVLAHGMPLIRVKPRDLAAVAVRRVPRTVGVRDGLPLLEDGRTLDVANVIWCTGFQPAFGWIDLPIFDPTTGRPRHERGVVPAAPGLYFVGLAFLYAASSAMIHGLDRDTARIAALVAARIASPTPSLSGARST